MIVWTIYDHPLDDPTHWVLVAWLTTDVVERVRSWPFAELDAARGAIPAGLTCVGRQADDDRAILESWL